MELHEFCLFERLQPTCQPTSHNPTMLNRSLPLGSRAATAFAVLSGFVVFTSRASAADVVPSTIAAGDTAWLRVATALVLFMMIPGLSLFYAGLVRSKNVLSIFTQCFALTAVLSLVWLACGYSLSFSDGGSFIGGLGRCFLNGITPESVRADCKTIPQLLHFAYQMMFFLITPGLFI